MKPKTILALTPIILFVILLLANIEPVRINFIIGHMEMPKLILMMVMLVIGILAGWFMHMSYRKNKQSKKQTQEVQANEINPTENA